MAKSKRQQHPKPEGFKPVPSWEKGHRWAGQPGRCQAWNPQHGRQCLQRAMKGKRVCAQDGGKSLSGPAHPNFKHGRRSRKMPKALLATFEDAVADQELLDLGADIATQEARIVQLIGNLGDRGPGELWEAALKAYDQLMEAAAAEDRDAVRLHRNVLGEILSLGSDEIGTWVLIQKHTEEKRRLIDTEARRREKMQNFIRMEDAAFSYRALAIAVKANVKDPATLAAIAEDWARTVALPDLSGITTSDV